MRATLAYTSARILLLVVAMILLYLAGARGLLLLVLAFVVSGIASFVLLSRQRDVMSGALFTRLRNRRPPAASPDAVGSGPRTAGPRTRAASLRTRLEEGARAEDDD